MQAYISRTMVPYETWGKAVVPLPAICAFCNEEVYSEYEPQDETYIYRPWHYYASSHVGFMPSPKFFHIRDNTPICDAKL